MRIIADCGGEIRIGDHVMIGPNTVIRSSGHRYDRPDIPMVEQGHKPGKITIGDDVWIAANVVILPDVKIGSHAVVAAGAVVTHDVPEYAIVAGIPAKVIRNRKD
ncbi:MAG TPA: acyltransferase [Methylophilaceae bacterium]